MSGSEKPRILVVDNDLTTTDMMARSLSGNYHIDVINSARKVLPHINNQPPDLVLLDVIIGDVQGYDICRQLKSNHLTKDIPIIFISSLSEPQNKVRGFRAGAVDYVTKPIEVTELKTRIQMHISMSRLKKNLEREVQQRTKDLEKSNSALRASLEHRETEMRAIEKNIMARIRKYIIPYLNKLETSTSENGCMLYIDIVRSNLDELIPSSANTLSACYMKLTPSELKVADLIRQGMQTKEIAGLLNLSTKSVFYYRNKIRKKFGLLKTKVNLTTYLNNLTL